MPSVSSDTQKALPDPDHTSHGCGSLIGQRSRKLSEEIDTGEISFSPPLYRQRYLAVTKIISDSSCEKIVDMGCAEGKLIDALKQVSTVREILGVDTDNNLLTVSSFRINPLTTDYLYPRVNSLHISLLHGSVDQYDYRLLDTDAIVMVELIEHLPAETLKKFPEVIFGTIHPKLVVITTPNSDYNVLFTNLNGFRHKDHKFEWSQKEFQKWCSEIACTYEYSVEYSGVGLPPADRADIGYCSQIATFTAIHPIQRRDITRNYKEVASAVHPSQPPVPLEERLSYELEFCIRNLRTKFRRSEDTSESSLFPFEDLTKFRSISSLTTDLDLISSCLKNRNIPLTENNEIQLDIEETSESEDSTDLPDNYESDDSQNADSKGENQSSHTADTDKDWATGNECWDLPESNWFSDSCDDCTSYLF